MRNSTFTRISARAANSDARSSSAPLVLHDPVLDLDVRDTLLFLLVAAAEDQEDRAAAFFLLGVAVLPHLAVVVQLVLAGGLAERRLHPCGGRLARLDAIERVGRDVIAGDVLLGVVRDQAAAEEKQRQ